MKTDFNDNEAKKEYLRRYEKAVRQMQRSEQRMQEIRLNKICPSVVVNGMPHTSGHGDLSGYAALMDQEEHKYMKARYQRVKICREIMDHIERLDNEDEKDVLTYRYIRLMKWEDICVRMDYKWAQAHRIHAKALEHFTIDF